MDKRIAEAIQDEVIQGLGPGWTGRVWENCGCWFVAWDCGAVKLHYEERDSNFWAMIGEVGERGGHMDFYYVGRTYHHKDPAEAVLAACKKAEKVIKTKWRPIEESVVDQILTLEKLL